MTARRNPPTARVFQCPSCGGPIEDTARACRSCRSTVATRRCGVCFDMNLAGDRNCRRCGRLLPRENAHSRPDRLACPGCGSAMTPRRMETTVFDECDHCGGLWLAPQTAQAVTTEAETRSLLKVFAPPAPPAPAASRRPDAGPAPAIAYRRCPICRKHMNRSAYAPGAGVIVDACREHGVHFDQGELARIFDHVESGGLEKARRRQAEALREQVRDARRKVISAGRQDFSLGSSGSDSLEPSGLDLLRWIASLLTRSV